MDAIGLIEQQRQKAAQKGESVMHSLQRSAVLTYLRLVKNGKKRQLASVMTATTINGKGAYCVKVIRNWANAFLHSSAIPVSEHEKHKKLGCFFRDEDVRKKIDTYLRENKFEVRIHTLTKYINEEVLPDLDDGFFVKLSERTVIRWMKIFGHNYREATKGMYMDRNERDDVVAYRGQFLAKMVEHEKRMPTFTDDYSDVIWPNLQNGEKPLIFVTHDESIFHAFDGQGKQWFPTGEQPLHKKGASLALHVSDFLANVCRCLTFIDGDVATNDECAKKACEIMKLLWTGLVRGKARKLGYNQARKYKTR
jgi:hypothetical protein